MFNLISDNRAFQCSQHLHVNISVIMSFDSFFNSDLLKIYQSDWLSSLNISVLKTLTQFRHNLQFSTDVSDSMAKKGLISQTMKMLKSFCYE